jgi:hypothetical protein
MQILIIILIIVGLIAIGNIYSFIKYLNAATEHEKQENYKEACFSYSQLLLHSLFSKIHGTYYKMKIQSLWNTNGPFDYEYKYNNIIQNREDTGDNEIELRDTIQYIGKIVDENKNA